MMAGDADVFNYFFSFSNGIRIYRTISFNTTDASASVPFNFPKASRRDLLKDLRCEEIQFIPHVHTTHLETKYHIYQDNKQSNDTSLLPLQLSRPLLTVILPTITIIDFDMLRCFEDVEFVILKVQNPKMSKFIGIEKDLIYKLKEIFPKLKIIGINEPSIDPEHDGGRVEAHKTFFKEIPSGFVVELLYLESEEIKCYEKYVCLLNIFRFDDKSDAYPCSPILYPLKSQQLQGSKSSSRMVLSDTCIFCKIIRGAIPSFKIHETPLTYAFLDINPLSEGHILVIPKFHGAKLHEVTDEHLADILPVARKILLEGFGENGAKLIPSYNVLQNNGRLAHQEVDHVHFHIIPKREEHDGLELKWSPQQGNMAQLSKLAESIRSKLSQSQ